MGTPLPFTPLNALDLVALDTETTGLDTGTARLVQIGAIRLSPSGEPTDDIFNSLVNPGVPIPPTATEIHGISDSDVAAAPTAMDALAGLAEFLGEAVVVGHTVGFDLEIFKREADRNNVAWQTPSALDVRPMAQAVLPSIRGQDLDGLCANLGIEIENRHSAIGDARAAAQVFQTLLPKLRDRQIRTLAEAHTLCRRVWEREGSSAISTESVEDREAVAPGRIDSYPYRNRVFEVMSAPPVTLAADQPLRAALDLLIGKSISSIFVKQHSDEWGILTERDVLRAINEIGPKALEQPIEKYCSVPLASVSSQDLVYRAIGRMDRLGIRHLGVTGLQGDLVGAVTTRNLLRHRATSAMVLGDEIAASKTDGALAAVWGKVPAMARQLGDEGVDARMTAAVISTEIQALTRRVAEIGELKLQEQGLGAPPANYAVLVLGSAGRGESLLAADQDNALVFDPRGIDQEQAEGYFERLGIHIADSLDAIGIPYCKGGVMASKREWRKSLPNWQKTVAGWVGKQRPEDLLNVDIFFDGIVVHGDRELGQTPRNVAFDQAHNQRSFLVALSQTMRDWRSPLTMLGGFRTGSDDRVDLKAGGLMPIFSVARILAIKARSTAHATPDRLRAAAEAGLASTNQLNDLIDAHRIILNAMLHQQILDADAGIRLGPKVAVGTLSKSRRNDLRDALKQVPGAIDLVREGTF